MAAKDTMGKLKVIKKDFYFTLITSQKILTGEIILKLDGVKSAVPTKYTIQISGNVHLMPYSNDPDILSSFFRFINHSCDPNAAFDIPGMNLIALKDIELNEE